MREAVQSGSTLHGVRCISQSCRGGTRRPSNRLSDAFRVAKIPCDGRKQRSIVISMREAQAYWIVAPGRSEIRSQPLRSPQAGELLVRTLFSAISRGTESLVFRGEVPEGERQRMRCPFQEGDFPGPVKYGYSAIGVVEDGSPGNLGRRVFCLHPHQDRFVVGEDAVIDVPEAVPDRRGILAANMETAVNGMWDGLPGPGDRISSLAPL